MAVPTAAIESALAFASYSAELVPGLPIHLGACTPLTPVAKHTNPPGIIASKSAPPACSAVAPSAPKIPVPIIMPAVISVAAVRPIVHAEELPGLLG
jgi:hypothetical protein